MTARSGAAPVGIAVAKDGALLISEDGNGTIWRGRRAALTAYPFSGRGRLASGQPRESDHAVCKPLFAALALSGIGRRCRPLLISTSLP